MRITTTLGVVATGCALAAATALPATAVAAHADKAGPFHSTISTHNPHTGTKVTLKATGALSKTSYICVFTVVKGTAHGEDLTNVTNVTSSKSGAFSCSLKFKPFSALVGSKNYSCPASKAEAKAGVKCAMAAAYIQNTKSETIQYFKAK